MQESISRRLEADVLAERAQRRRYELTSENFTGGVGLYLDVLLAQNDWFSAQQTIVQTRFAKISSMISLYKALGGGWTETTVPAEDQQTPSAAQEKNS